ncbi:SURF1 family protein [Alteromonas sp. H39]|uniref:SURF1 family protein n=1 Tax=Alteromonas sp. H39 TaxID=3389876 RepID=UPI0039E022C8
MCGLGFWQLDRMEQKEQRLASIAQKQSGGLMGLQTAIRSAGDPRDLRVAFTGTPDTSRMMYLDNQIENGQVGYDIVLPVRTDVGWALVNYGWVKGLPTRDTLPQVEIGKSLTEYEGVVTSPGYNPMVTETAVNATFPLRIQALDTDYLSTLLRTPLIDYVVVLTTPDDKFIRNWSPVVMPPEKHLGYAIQWFGLAFAALIIGLLALRKKELSHE